MASKNRRHGAAATKLNDLAVPSDGSCERLKKGLLAVTIPHYTYGRFRLIMADISHHQFVALLKRSNVVDPKKLPDWLKKNAQVDNARKLAKSLVQEGMLTTWQAKFLLSGRHRLRIGNYHLLTRLRRDEFGARYLAVHASLARKVELQIFSKDLTSDTQRWKDMIQKASLVATLDHPGLVHVYDIDHDDERYFLVVEHVAGRELDVERDVFTPRQIGNLILQCVESIDFAHQNKVVHGTIGSRDILLTDKGTVKIQNLTVSPLRNLKLQATESKVIDDYQALASLGHKLLKANPGSSAGIGEPLESIFSALAKEGKGALPQLTQWADANPDSSMSAGRVTSSGAFPILPEQLRSQSGKSASGVNSAVDPSNLYDAKSFASSASFSSSASIIQVAKGNRVFMIAGAIALMLFGGIVVFGLTRAYNKFTRPDKNTVGVTQSLDAQTEVGKSGSKVTRKEVGEVRLVSGGGVETEKTSEKVLDELIELVDQEETESSVGQVDKGLGDAKAAVPEGETIVDSDAATESSAVDEKAEDKRPIDSKYSDILGIRGGKPSEASGDVKVASNETLTSGKPAKQDDPVVIPPAEKETADKLEKIKGIGPATEKALKSAGIKTFGQLAKMKAAHVVQVLKDGTINKSEAASQGFIDEAKAIVSSPSGDPNSADPDNHFALVSSEFSLPPIDSIEPKKLTDLKIPGNYQLSAELISPDGVAPKRMFFDLQPSGTDSQTWLVGLKKKASSSKTKPLANIQKTAEALNFSWSPEAADEKSAPYLKNCFLRISTPDGRAKVAALREPVKVRSLRITQKQLVDELRLNIEAMPKISNLRVDLMGIPKGEPELEMVRATVAGNVPAVIGLKEEEKPEDQFLTFQVAADAKAKTIKLIGGLVLANQQGPVLVKNVDQLVLIGSQLAANRKRLENKLAAKPSDRNVSKQKTAAKRKDERMGDYMQSINRLMTGGGGVGEPIDFEVTAEFEAGRIVLMRSSKNFVEDDSIKKNKK